MVSIHSEILLFLILPRGGWDRAKKTEDSQGQRERLPLLGLGGDRSPSEDPNSPSWLALGLFRIRLKEAEILPSGGTFPGIHKCLICKQTLICLLEVPLSRLELCQPGEVTVSERSTAGAMAEPLSHAATGERSRRGSPHAASPGRLSLSMKLL